MKEINDNEIRIIGHTLPYRPSLNPERSTADENAKKHLSDSDSRQSEEDISPNIPEAERTDWRRTEEQRNPECSRDRFQHGTTKYYSFDLEGFDGSSDSSLDRTFKEKDKKRNTSEKHTLIRWIYVIIILIAGLAVFIIIRRQGNNKDITETTEAKPYPNAISESREKPTTTNKNVLYTATVNKKEEYCNIGRFIVNNIPLKIFDPMKAVPEFHLGKLDTTDSQIVLACQAADIREDNGEIVGACINNGEIISKGISKAGFVAIINKQIKIGVELNSPYFEEAIQSNGSFFRQYALIKDGLIIENNLNNKSIRRAICEKEGKIFVMETESKETFHNFSQALVDYGVNNAVYLVGSSYAHGLCRLNPESVEEWGNPSIDNQKYVTYIVWKLGN